MSKKCSYVKIRFFCVHFTLFHCVVLRFFGTQKSTFVFPYCSARHGLFDPEDLIVDDATLDDSYFNVAGTEMRSFAIVPLQFTESNLIPVRVSEEKVSETPPKVEELPVRTKSRLSKILSNVSSSSEMSASSQRLPPESHQEVNEVRRVPERESYTIPPASAKEKRSQDAPEKETAFEGQKEVMQESARKDLEQFKSRLKESLEVEKKAIESKYRAAHEGQIAFMNEEFSKRREAEERNLRESLAQEVAILNKRMLEDLEEERSKLIEIFDTELARARMDLEAKKRDELLKRQKDLEESFHKEFEEFKSKTRSSLEEEKIKAENFFREGLTKEIAVLREELFFAKGNINPGASANDPKAKRIQFHESDVRDVIEKTPDEYSRGVATTSSELEEMKEDLRKGLAGEIRELEGEIKKLRLELTKTRAAGVPPAASASGGGDSVEEEDLVEPLPSKGLLKGNQLS